MRIRVVQIWGFLMTVMGWIFVACTMAMEGWKITSVGGMGGSSILKVAWYWSSLWRACFTDSTAVSNCYDYPVLWSVEGLLSTSGYVVYAQYVSGEYFNPNFDGLKYDLGTPLFLGWVGSSFQVAGGVFYLWSACKPLCGQEQTVIIRPVPDPEQDPKTKSTTELSSVSGITSKTKVSSVSELSSERSDVSVISSASTSGGSVESGSRPLTSSAGSASESAVSSGSSVSTRSGSSGGSRVTSLSGSSGTGRASFLKNSYI
nr:uncharacterized protein LOC133615218 isoform X2 [Nerophis lumbriciformis]